MTRMQALAKVERWKSVRTVGISVELLDAIVAALNAGATWAEVGQRLDMAASNANRKYGRYLESVTTYKIKDPGRCVHQVPLNLACDRCAQGNRIARPSSSATAHG